jgi:hypothetical protein
MFDARTGLQQRAKPSRARRSRESWRRSGRMKFDLLPIGKIGFGSR